MRIVKGCFIAFLLVVAIGVLAMACVLLLFNINVVQPYKEFQTQEAKITDRFVLLNHDVYNQLPPPSGVKQTELSDFAGGSNFTYHGQWLMVDYDIIDGSTEDVFNYYEQKLSSMGWKKSYDNSNLYPTGIWRTADFYRETSCLNMHLGPKSYRIIIWHDFLNQNFSPQLPPDWVMGFHEFGETQIATCP